MIDDGSTDGTADMVSMKVPPDKLTILSGNGTWWWAGSLQQGIDWLKGHDIYDSDVVLIINDDTTFGKEFLEQGVRFIMEHPDTLLLAQNLDPETGNILESGVRLDWLWLGMSCQTANSSEEINCLSTRGLFLSFRALLKTGDFHPVLLPHYYSDYEYTMRSINKGMRLCTIPEVHLVVNEATTGVRRSGNRNFLDEWQTMFSKRCTYNPVYTTIFIFFSCPFRRMVSAILRVWVGTVKRLVESLI